MQVLLTEADRHACTRYAWECVRGLPLPRKVRLLLRDKIADAALARLKAGGTTMEAKHDHDRPASDCV